MKLRHPLTATFILAGLAIFTGVSPAQAPAAGRGGRGPAFEVNATLQQLMKGILYPASNVVFLAQGTNPNDVQPDKDPSAAVNPLASAYGKWEAVENASLAMNEAANLLLLPGRKCSNGKPVPIGNADWPKFVQGLREASMVAYKAAQSKDQDKILDAADKLTTACANCHDRYREKANPADRCLAGPSK
jgi:cytochrome c556